LKNGTNENVLTVIAQMICNIYLFCCLPPFVVSYTLNNYIYSVKKLISNHNFLTLEKKFNNFLLKMPPKRRAAAAKRKAPAAKAGLSIYLFD